MFRPALHIHYHFDAILAALSRGGGIWECHDCHEREISPGTYKNNHGEIVKVGPKSLDPDTEVLRF